MIKNSSVIISISVFRIEFNSLCKIMQCLIILFGLLVQCTSIIIQFIRIGTNFQCCSVILFCQLNFFERFIEYCSLIIQLNLIRVQRNCFTIVFFSFCEFFQLIIQICSFYVEVGIFRCNLDLLGQIQNILFLASFLFIFLYLLNILILLDFDIFGSIWLTCKLIYFLFNSIYKFCEFFIFSFDFFLSTSIFLYIRFINKIIIKYFHFFSSNLTTFLILDFIKCKLEAIIKSHYSFRREPFQVSCQQFLQLFYNSLNFISKLLYVIRFYLSFSGWHSRKIS